MARTRGCSTPSSTRWKPAALDELLIRLDDGRAVILLQEEMQRFEPGQPVRLLSETSGMRFERHD